MPGKAQPTLSGAADSAATALPVPVNQAVQQIDLSRAAQQYTVLGPASVVSAREGLKIMASVIKLSLDPEDGDVYPAPAGQGKLALGKIGLLKIAEAKGIIFDPRQCHKIDDAGPCEACASAAALAGQDAHCAHNVGFQAVGGWFDYTGRFLTYKATKYWRWDEELNEVQRVAAKQNKGEDWVRQEFAKRYRDRMALAETKALLRVIRMAGLKAAYTRDELGRGLFVPRIEPDLSAEEVRRRAMASSIQIFGTPAALKALPEVIFDEAQDAGEDGDEAEAAQPAAPAADDADRGLRDEIIALAKQHFGETPEGVGQLQEFLKAGWNVTRARDLTAEQKAQARDALQEMIGKTAEGGGDTGREPWADA